MGPFFTFPFRGKEQLASRHDAPQYVFGRIGNTLKAMTKKEEIDVCPCVRQSGMCVHAYVCGVCMLLDILMCVFVCLCLRVYVCVFV